MGAWVLVGLFILLILYNFVFVYSYRHFYRPRETVRQEGKITAERAEAEYRAWQALEPMLSIEQRLQKEKYGYILERGSWGYYIIPMTRVSVLFQADKTFQGLEERMNAWKDRRIIQQNLAASLSRCSICLSNTGREAPWYDAIATFLYTIRNGNESIIFERGNVQSLNFITSRPSDVIHILEEEWEKQNQQGGAQ